MSNLINDFKKNKLTRLSNSYNKTIFILNNNYNVEIRNINRLRVHTNLKIQYINNVNKKYKEIINNVKISFENEIKKTNIYQRHLNLLYKRIIKKH